MEFDKTVVYFDQHLGAADSKRWLKYQGEVKWAVILMTKEFVYSLPDDLGSSC